MFACDKCGLCCTKLSGLPIYSEFDRGDGVCKFFDEELRLCTIYPKRPLVCNVEKSYEKFFKWSISKEEYYKANYEACRELKEKSVRGKGNVFIHVK